MFAEKTTTNKGGTSAGAGALPADRQVLQRKLSVGSSHDPQEQEADRTADTVMRRPEQDFIQRKCAGCEKETADKLKTAADKLETDKQNILDALHKGDAPIFLSRLRALDAEEAASLLADTGFWQEIKKNFHGSALWSAFTILFFHGKMSLSQRMLSVALFSKNITDAMDDLAVIIARENVADPMYWDVLEEVIFTVFAGDPKLPDLYKLLILPKSQYSGPRNLSFRSSEVHYEEIKDKKGDYALTEYHNTRQQVAYSTRSELRAVVTIRLVDAQDKTRGFNFTGAESGVPAAWKAAIEAAWNNQFELSNGIDTLRFTVSPLFTFEAGHEDAVVEIHNDRKQKCDNVDQPGRETSACWFTDTGADTVSHEFGHLLGANDEYQLPGSAAEIPADMKKRLSADDIALSNMTDIKNDGRAAGTPAVAPLPFKKGGYTINGQMGHHDKDSVEVKGRHLRLLINAFNASLPPGTPPYILKKI